jgi:hypothetical protein
LEYVRDDRVGALGGRASDENSSRDMILAELERGLKRYQDSMARDSRGKLPDNGVLLGQDLVDIVVWHVVWS